MVNERIRRIFKRGSRTYYYSTLFFPKDVKEDVFKLYSFVRVADDLVDRVPQDKDGFYAFKQMYEDALKGKTTGDVVIDSFVELSNRKGFDTRWTEAFFRSMEMDLHKNRYETLEELDEYLYGSAEVIGLFMSRILGLPDRTHAHARMLGKAMQFINFIRDIDEDHTLGRVYFPRKELSRYGLADLSENEALSKRKEFKAFIRSQVKLWRTWQKEAEHGFRFIPRRYLLPIKTASDMYKLTALRISLNPFIIFRKKVKPATYVVVMSYVWNRIRPRMSAMNHVDAA